MIDADKIKKYDKTDYKSSLLNVNDYITEKLDNIHSQLFFSALKKAFKDIKFDYAEKLEIEIAKENGKDYRLIKDLTEEQLNALSDYDENWPRKFVSKDVNDEYIALVSSITFDDFFYAHKIKEIKEDEFFKPSKVMIRSIKFPYTTYNIDLTEYWDDYQYSLIEKDFRQKLDNTEELNNAKIIYIDYVNGKSKLRKRMTGEEFWISNDYINDDLEIDDDYTLKNTFTYKLKNI